MEQSFLGRDDIDHGQLLDHSKQLTAQQQLVFLACLKTTLTFDEAVAYTGFTKSYLYKLTSGKKIPHYCPSGKLLFFDRQELDNWLKRNRVKTSDEIAQEAINYVVGNDLNRRGGRRAA